MAFSLDNVVPWGRSFPEYLKMFALAEEDCGKRILGVGDGPASFNAVLSSQGGHVVSVDPLYRFTADEIRQRIGETFETVLDQTRQNVAEFNWRHIPSVEELGRVRMSAMEEFLFDYTRGREEGRYREAGLPRLPFGRGEFDLALCSHFLFLYSKLLSLEFHVALPGSTGGQDFSPPGAGGPPFSPPRSGHETTGRRRVPRGNRVGPL